MTQRLVWLPIFLAVLSLGGCNTFLAESSSRAVSTVFTAGEDGYRIYRIPVIIKAANGDLLAFAEGRDGGDLSELDLVMRRSGDNGLTWGALSVVQESARFEALLREGTEVSVGNPAPVVDLINPAHPGRIWLPFTLENDRVFISYSDDHGVSWSAAREISSAVKKPGWGWYATGPVHSIQVQRGPHAGRLVIPANHRVGKAGADRGPTGAQVIFSDDFGQSWSLGAVDEAYRDSFHPSETTVVELLDGRLLFNSRDQHGAAPGTRGDAYSSDAGETFDPPADPDYPHFQPSSPVLDPPVVQGALLRGGLKEEGDRADVLLFSGPDSNGPNGRGRSDLMIRYSLDEGNSWRDGLRINVGPAAYSDMVRLSGEQFGVLYESGDNKNYQRIDFALFSLSELDGISAESR